MSKPYLAFVQAMEMAKYELMGFDKAIKKVRAKSAKTKSKPYLALVQAREMAKYELRGFDKAIKKVRAKSAKSAKSDKTTP
jgi:protein involved in ribonucleotide reduction